MNREQGWWNSPGSSQFLFSEQSLPGCEHGATHFPHAPWRDSGEESVPDSPWAAGFELPAMPHMTAASPLLVAALGSSSMRQFRFWDTKGDLLSQAAAQGWEQL